MTYQEAQQLKQGIHGNIIFDNHIPYHTIIAPKLQKDFLEFYKIFMYDFGLYHDELCKEYSTNDEYILRAHITDEGREILMSSSR